MIKVQTPDEKRLRKFRDQRKSEISFGCEYILVRCVVLRKKMRGRLPAAFAIAAIAALVLLCRMKDNALSQRATACSEIVSTISRNAKHENRALSARIS